MTIKELTERQAWTLTQKIDHSLGVIDQFASHFNGQVYVSFSGGKDSVAMLSLVEVIIPNVKSVFVMTGCESPSVCRFIRQQQQQHEGEGGGACRGKAGTMEGLAAESIHKQERQ